MTSLGHIYWFISGGSIPSISLVHNIKHLQVENKVTFVKTIVHEVFVAVVVVAVGLFAITTSRDSAVVICRANEAWDEPKHMAICLHYITAACKDDVRSVQRYCLGVTELLLKES